MLPQNDRFPTLQDRFRLDDARGCGEHEARVKASLVSGDWGWVDELPEPVESRVCDLPEHLADDRRAA